MRKFLNTLLVMLVVSLFGVKAQAGTTWNFSIDIDHPEAVTFSQNYDGSNPISLHSGVNNISLNDDYGYGASFYLICNGDYIFSSVVANGSQETLWDTKRYSGNVNQQNYSFVVRTATLDELRSESVTINTQVSDLDLE